MDLGDRHHHVCVLDADSEILAREVIVNTRSGDGLLRALSRGDDRAGDRHA